MFSSTCSLGNQRQRQYVLVRKQPTSGRKINPSRTPLIQRHPTYNRSVIPNNAPLQRKEPAKVAPTINHQHKPIEQSSVKKINIQPAVVQQQKPIRVVQSTNQLPSIPAPIVPKEQSNSEKGHSIGKPKVLEKRFETKLFFADGSSLQDESPVLLPIH